VRRSRLESMFARCLVALTVLGVLLAILAAPAAADPAADAAGRVRSLVQSGARTCPHVTIETVIATPTTPSEVTAFRPAGYDVAVRVTGAGGVTALFLVSGGQVYPDNSLAGELLEGCRRDPPAPRTALAWHGLPYMDPSDGEIQVGSDGPWHGGHANHRLPSLAAPIPEGDGTPIWAGACRAGTQTVRFDRTLYLLGRPDSLSVTLSTVTAGGRDPLTSASLLINGHRVLAAAPAAGLTTLTAHLRSAALHEVAYGANRFEVVLRKARSGRCNGRGRRQVGVRFLLVGYFHAATTGSSLELQGANGVCSPSCGGSFVLPFEFRVTGPSALLEPQFTFAITFAEPGQLVPPIRAEEGGIKRGRCNESERGSLTVVLICTWPPFPARTSGRLNFTVVYGVSAEPPFKERFRVAWELPGQTSVSGVKVHGAAGQRLLAVCYPVGPGCRAPVS
jgi:hypothetical protein